MQDSLHRMGAMDASVAKGGDGRHIATPAGSVAGGFYRWTSKSASSNTTAGFTGFFGDGCTNP